jgi:putative Holliday junction resolvase
VIGVDYGRKRVGLAMSDPLGMTARPLEVVARAMAVDRVAQLAEEHEVETIVVGLPRPLGGGDSDSARLARELGDEIQSVTGVEVVFVDERYTSKMAEESLLEAGVKRRSRRITVDKVAAAIILQGYLDGNSRRSGDVKGTGAR